MTEQTVEILCEIFDERVHQVEVKGWTAEHDDRHTSGELAQGAACYAMYPRLREYLERNGHEMWPFDTSPKFKSRREDLIRAAAMIVAEIERLDRLAPPVMTDAEVQARMDRAGFVTPEDRR